VAKQDFGAWDSSSQIDPLLLRLLQKKYEEASATDSARTRKVRRLGLAYAAFFGVGAMILVIFLGLLRGIGVDEILLNGSRTLFLYCVIGFVAGKIAEMCVHESAKSMLREMLARTEHLRNASPYGEGENEL
jgi:hypothetical protein